MASDAEYDAVPGQDSDDAEEAAEIVVRPLPPDRESAGEEGQLFRNGQPDTTEAQDPEHCEVLILLE